MTADDIRAVVAKRIAMVKDGDLAAAAMLLDRVVGKVPASMIAERTSTAKRNKG